MAEWQTCCWQCRQREEAATVYKGYNIVVWDNNTYFMYIYYKENIIFKCLWRFSVVVVLNAFSNWTLLLLLLLWIRVFCYCLLIWSFNSKYTTVLIFSLSKCKTKVLSSHSTEFYWEMKTFWLNISNFLLLYSVIAVILALIFPYIETVL